MDIEQIRETDQTLVGILRCIENRDQSALLDMVPGTIEVLHNLLLGGDFAEIESEGRRLLHSLGEMRIFERLAEQDHLEPALRAALVAADAASQLNELSLLAGGEERLNVVSPFAAGVTALLGELAYVIGQDDEYISRMELDTVFPDETEFLQSLGIQNLPKGHLLHPSVLVARFLHRQNAPNFALNTIRSSHNFPLGSATTLESLFAALARANIGRSAYTGEWGYWISVATVLLAMPAYAQFLDGQPPVPERWEVERAQMVPIYTALQHILRIFGGIDFARSTFSERDVPDEKQQRFSVVRTLLRRMGLPLPGATILDRKLGVFSNLPVLAEGNGDGAEILEKYPPEVLAALESDYGEQEAKAAELRRWLDSIGIEDRIAELRAQRVKMNLSDCYGMPELLRHMAEQFNDISIASGAGPVLCPEYAYNLGMAQIAAMLFTDEEKDRFCDYRGYLADFCRRHPPEVRAARDLFAPAVLRERPDAMLYCALREWEEKNVVIEERLRRPSLALDALSGMFNVDSFWACLIYYAEMAVKGEGYVWYSPEITERFLQKATSYTSVPAQAAETYTKLMTLEFICWYLGFKLPKEGAIAFDEDALEHVEQYGFPATQLQARDALVQIGKVLSRFDIPLPPAYYALVEEANEEEERILREIEAGGISVIIIEDSERVQSELAAIVGGFGITNLWQVETVEAARLIIEKYQPDIVLLDHDLGGETTTLLFPVLVSYPVQVIGISDKAAIHSFVDVNAIRSDEERGICLDVLIEGLQKVLPDILQKVRDQRGTS